MKKGTISLAIMTGGSLLLTVPLSALAQSNQEAGGKDKPWVLEEVVVTAQKREESFNDVSLSVSVVSGDALAAAGIDSIADLGQVVPGLMFSRLGSYAVPTIRGITTNSVLNEPNIATVMDGVYLPTTGTMLTELNNIAAIEVLKGPQGTLFGRNATGGVVNIVTLTPSQDTGGNIELGLAGFNQKSISAYGTTGLSEKIAADIAAVYVENDGYINNVTTGNEAGVVERGGVRSKMRIDASDTIAIDLTAFYTVDHGNGSSTSQPFKGYSDFNNIPGANVLTRDFTTGGDYDETLKTKTYGGSIKIDIDRGTHTWRSITSYREDSIEQGSDQDRTNLPIVIANNGVWQNTWTQEFNLLSNFDGPINFTSGLYYYGSTQNLPINVWQGVSTTAGAPGFKSRGQENIESYSAFGEVTWQATDHLSLLGGLRYTSEERDAKVHQVAGDFDLGTVKDDETWDEPSWRLSARYALSDDTNVYATYGRGFKSGGFNISSNPPGKNDAETLDAYEIGIKSEGDRWRMSAAAYYMEYDNVQIQSFDPLTSTSFSQAAATETAGLEFDLTYALTDGLTLSGGLNWMPTAEYTKYKDANVFVPDTTTPYGVENLLPPPDLKGTDTLRSPEYSGNITLNYQHELFNGTWDSTANFAYLSSFYWVPGEVPEQKQDAYSVVNVSTSWLSPSEKYSLKLWVKNATDERYAQSYNAGSTDFLVFWAPPRQVGGSVTVFF